MTDLESPIGVLEAILDEVSGVRTTDQRSHLPRELVEAIREVTGRLGSAGPAGLSTLEQLEGRTVRHVWTSHLRRGAQAVLYCDDGCFLALKATSMDDYAEVAVESGRCRTVAEFVDLRILEAARLISPEEASRRRAEEAEDAAQSAREQVARAQARLEAAEKDLARATAAHPDGALAVAALLTDGTATASAA